MKRRWVIALASVAVAQASMAQDAPLSRAAIAEDMHAYYDSEKSTTLTMMSFGVLSIASGAVLVTRSDDVSRSMGWSLIGLGALAGLGGFTYLLTVNNEIVTWAKALETDPAAFQRNEAAHIQGTLNRFFWYRTVELVLLAGGVGATAYGLVSGRQVWQGIGLGVGIEAGLLLTVDTLGNHRAEEYEDRLKRLDVNLALQPSGPGRPFLLAVSGRY